MTLRIGHGYDVHRLVAGRPLVLGGERIAHDKGLEGFSDADVLLHAVTDAILGATGAGDIGSHFPPGDPRFRDADSAELLRQVVEQAAADGWGVVSCDTTVVAEAPKLAPYRDAIRRRLAACLRVEVPAVGFKATTHEGLGAIGRGEGIAAWAVVLLEKRSR